MSSRSNGESFRVLTDPVSGREDIVPWLYRGKPFSARGLMNRSGQGLRVEPVIVATFRWSDCSAVVSLDSNAHANEQLLQHADPLPKLKRGL